MERTYINEAQKAIGGTVKVQGFIENLRNSKYMAFIVLKDITGKLQITVEKADHPELVDTIDQLTPDSVITVTGKVMENDYVKMGGVEMIPESIEVESTANALPIVRKEIAATKKKKAVERSSIDQRIDYRWIDLRTDENQLMFKAQSCFVNAMRKFLLDRNFIEIHTPKLIAAASESGSEVFKVDYFDRNAYLAPVSYTHLITMSICPLDCLQRPLFAFHLVPHYQQTGQMYGSRQHPADGVADVQHERCAVQLEDRCV